MAARSLRAECRVGDVLSGRWRLERLLGTGGMSQVFAATHRNSHRVAIKMLRPELARDRELCARFLREGYVANRIGHRAAVRVLDDDFTAGGTPYLVMELLEGETLSGRLSRSGRLPGDEVLLVAEEALGLLVEAHRRGIVHRDLKPDNLFVTRDGYLKVLDFGLARVRQGPRARVSSLRFGVVVGTPAYMAPEQARGDWQAVDERTDLWALGATLFTLSTGLAVHERATTREQLAAAIALPPRPVRERCPFVPPALANIIDRALAFDADERWPSAQAMLHAVRAAQGLPPLSVRSAPPEPTPWIDLEAPGSAPLVRRRPLSWPVRAAIIAAVALLLVLLAIAVRLYLTIVVTVSQPRAISTWPPTVSWKASQVLGQTRILLGVAPLSGSTS